MRFAWIQTFCNKALRLGKDLSQGRGVPAGWGRHRGRPRMTWIIQLRKDTNIPVAISWKLALDRQLWRADAMALTGYAI